MAKCKRLHYNISGNRSKNPAAHRPHPNGKTAWDILKKNFEPSSRAQLAGSLDEFFEPKFDPDKETRRTNFERKF